MPVVNPSSPSIAASYSALRSDNVAFTIPVNAGQPENGYFPRFWILAICVFLMPEPSVIYLRLAQLAKA